MREFGSPCRVQLLPKIRKMNLVKSSINHQVNLKGILQTDLERTQHDVIPTVANIDGVWTGLLRCVGAFVGVGSNLALLTLLLSSVW